MDDENRNEVVVRSGRTLQMGTESWEIRDNGTPVQYVDLITEAREVNKVFYVSFASAIIDGQNPGIASIATRLRIDIGTAQYLHDLLEKLIQNALMPTDITKAN
ncbi:hypothetical protein ILFOPFJJ_05813 [Ensifer psoraleae]|uniref:hypothetical protein n=1 Tax=Sinorhizobium psoraleae TaxID=520838 RepID=UPI00156951F9|nr:hypothetical protein [Sinorhizobium psoraleae]NRP74890.1 hypothetical protein [Sinorhizobium psoraleae]